MKHSVTADSQVENNHDGRNEADGDTEHTRPARRLNAAHEEVAGGAPKRAWRRTLNETLVRRVVQTLSK